MPEYIRIGRPDDSPALDWWRMVRLCALIVLVLCLVLVLID